jgi:dynein light chain roadblock-type
MDDELTHKYAANMSALASKARSVVRDLDPTNDLTFLRVRSKKHEVMLAPDKDFLLIVIQDAAVSQK